MLARGLLPFFRPSRSSALRKGRRSASLTHNLIVLVASVALPLMLLGTSALWLQYRNERQLAEAQLVEHARSLARLVDREIDATRAVAEALAATVPAAHGDLDVLEAEFRATRDRLAANLSVGESAQIITLLDSRGTWLLNTAWPPGQRRTGVPATSLARAAIAQGRPQLSDLFNGPSAGIPLVGIAVPVFDSAPSADGHPPVIGGIGISVPREHLIAIATDVNLPETSVISILDRKGAIVARSLRDAETVGHVPPAALLRPLAAAAAGIAPRGIKTIENVPAVMAFAHAPRSNYVVSIAVSEQTFLAPLRRSLWQSMTVGGLVLATGLAMAILSARRTVRAFSLALGATADARLSAPADTGSTGLREADEFKAHLARAFAEREQAARNARTMFDNSPIGIVIFDADGVVHEANQAFCSMVGFPEAELRNGAFDWDSIQPAPPSTPQADAFARVGTLGECRPYETDYRRRDGGRIPVLVSFGVTDRTAGLTAAFVMDITHQRQAEAAQRELEQRLHFCLQAGRLGAWEVDLVNQQLECSDTNKAVFGLDPAKDFSFTQLFEAVHPADRVRVRQAMTEATEHQDYRVEFRVQWPDGTMHWIEARGQMFQADGKAGRLAGVSTDITERKQAEAALQESELRLRAITDTMPQIVWSTRADGYHDYYNRRWYELTGRRPDQNPGEGWAPALHPDDQNQAWTRWRHSLATGEPYESEYRLRTADGLYRWMLGRAVPIRDLETGAIARWFGTCTDIEDTVAARETLARSREELERLVAERTSDLEATQVRLAQAQRMEALGQLAGGIAHDFNNVLQAVQGGGALLQRNPKDSEGVRRLSQMILEASDRGAATTRRLLAFSRRSELQAEPVDTIGLLHSMRDILSHTLGDGIRVDVLTNNDAPPLLADKGQLETVLINLATNARDAMAGIGTLILAATREVVQPDQTHLHRADLAAGAYVRLAVTDTGIGMDAWTLSRASEPFFTTKPAGHGTGLGLAMARGFVGQSGGGFHIASSPGRGTTVSLWFPVAESSAPAAIEAAPDVTAPSPASRRHTRVLLVDDDAIVREITAEVMEASGFEVRVADSAAAALTLLRHDQQVDILVSDLSMPDMDGLSLIREVHQDRPGLPAILLTGFATNAAELAVGGALNGSFTLLRKPIQGQQLAERVNSLLEAAASQA